jgi:hypothetical protein
MRIGSLMAEAEHAEVMDTCVRLIYERVSSPTACVRANCQITIRIWISTGYNFGMLVVCAVWSGSLPPTIDFLALDHHCTEPKARDLKSACR